MLFLIQFYIICLDKTYNKKNDINLLTSCNQFIVKFLLGIFIFIILKD